MPAAPKKEIKLSRPAPTLSVRVGPTDGTAPTAEDEVDWLHPLKIERSINGSRLTTIEFKYDLGLTEEKLVDTLTPKGVTRQIEIRELDQDGNAKRLLAWGKLSAQPVDIDGKAHSVSYVVRIDRHLLGQPLTRTPFWNPISGAVSDLDLPMTFNPEIDEIVTSNCSSDLDAARGNAYCFFDSAGADTAAARATHGQALSHWRIAEAAHRLCWLLNSAETFVKNPTLEELYASLGDLDNNANEQRLRNLTMAPGRYLNELLDDLLIPFGACWFINLSIDADGNSVRRLKFFIRSAGTRKELLLQRSGPLDPKKTSLTKLNLNFDIASLANRIVARSSRRQVEGTFELYKAWPEAEDTLDLEDLKSVPATQKAHPHAGRMWVLNESGKWTGLRPEITDFTNLVAFMGTTTLPICRKFHPCLSRVPSDASDKLESRGLVVEYDLDDGEGWKPVSALTNGSFSNLQQECGIWFETPPTELWEAINSDPSSVSLRITATIEGDRGLQSIATRQATSPNGDDVTLFLDLSDKFHYKHVSSLSIYAADVATADEIDDQTRMDQYVEEVRRIEDAAELSCSAELEGIDHPEYQLGDLITRVNGLNISLIRDNPPPGTEGKPLQIVGLTLDIQGQRTQLLLETFDEEKLT